MATTFGTQNTFLTPDVIAREALLILENNIVSTQMMESSTTADFTGAKVGDTIRVRRPAFFGVDDFAGTANVKIQDAVESSVNLQIEKHFDISFEVSSRELAFAVDDFNERLLRPAMSALSQKIDEYALTKIKDLGGLAEADYSAPNSLADVAAIVEKMNIQKIPMQNRKLLVSPAMQTALYSIPEFVRADIRGAASSPVEEASLGRFMGLDTMMSQVLPTHTVGNAISAPLGDISGTVNVAGGLRAGATTITLDGLADPVPGTNNAVKAGDTIRITYADGVARDHVITGDQLITDTNPGTLVVNINPGLYGISVAAVDQSATPDHAPVVLDNAVALLTGGTNSVPTYTVGAAFHPSAFQMVFVPQPNPMGPGTSSSTVNYNGMSLRVMQTYDHLKKRDLISVDCLVGAAAVDGRLGVRIPSNGG